jgi:hypothetical protein
MDRKLMILVLTAILLLSLAGMLYLYTRGRQEQERLRQAEARELAAPTQEMSAPPPADPALGSVKVRLYFRSGGSAAGPLALLRPVPREVPLAKDRVAFTRILLEALLQGPADNEGYRTLPSGTFVRQVFIVERTAVVDLSRDVSERHPGGVLEELATIYSVTNTVADNVAGVDNIRILVDGLERPTLAGHVGLNQSFGYSPEYVVGWKPREPMIQEENLR